MVGWPTVAVGVDGVQMSCQELDDDLALIQVRLPVAGAKRRGGPRARNLTFFFAGGARGS